jgi:hypothetical protein
MFVNFTTTYLDGSTEETHRDFNTLGDAIDFAESLAPHNAFRSIETDDGAELTLHEARVRLNPCSAHTNECNMAYARESGCICGGRL